MKTICVHHSHKTRFDPPNGCWPMCLRCSSHKLSYNKVTQLVVLTSFNQIKAMLWGDGLENKVQANKDVFFCLDIFHTGFPEQKLFRLRVCTGIPTIVNKNITSIQITI